VVERPIQPKVDPVVVPINDDPGVDFRDWLASRAPAGSVDIGGAAADVIRDMRENCEG
jgi:hypothetical protein